MLQMVNNWILKLKTAICGVIDKAGGIKNDVKKTEEWEVIWIDRKAEVKDRHSRHWGHHNKRHE